MPCRILLNMVDIVSFQGSVLVHDIVAYRSSVLYVGRHCEIAACVTSRQCV